jgi:hypothetical protein
MAPTVALPDGWEIVIPVLTGSKRKDSGSVETPGAREDFAAHHALLSPFSQKKFGSVKAFIRG